MRKKEVLKRIGIKTHQGHQRAEKQKALSDIFDQFGQMSEGSKYFYAPDTSAGMIKLFFPLAQCAFGITCLLFF